MVKQSCSRAVSRLSAVRMDPVDGLYRPGAAFRPWAWNQTLLHLATLGAHTSTEMSEELDADGETEVASGYE